MASVFQAADPDWNRIKTFLRWLGLLLGMEANQDGAVARGASMLTASVKKGVR
jgi:hypothetical protein